MTIYTAIKKMWLSNCPTMSEKELAGNQVAWHATIIKEILEADGPCLMGSENGHFHFVHYPKYRKLSLTLKGKKPKEVSYRSFECAVDVHIIRPMQRALEAK